MRRVLRFLGIFVAIFLAALVIAGFTYEQIGRRRDARTLPPRVGQAVDVGGGRTINMFCSGEGSPAVIFESGGRGLGYDWVQVQAEVAKYTRACWYDRAGQGWSDMPSRVEFSDDMIADLHKALEGMKVNPPYVLVGASVGGEYIRLFTAKHPAEVSGLVFVDSSVPEMQEPEGLRGPANKLPTWARRTLCTTLPLAYRLGLLRLLEPSRVPVPERFTEDQRRTYAVLKKETRSFDVEGEKACAATQGGRINRNAGTGNPELDDAAAAVTSLGDRPLVVLTAGRALFPAPRSYEEKEVAAFQNIWIHELQPTLAKLSTRGRQVVVTDADHGIEFAAPEVVLKAIREVWDESQR